MNNVYFVSEPVRKLEKVMKMNFEKNNLFDIKSNEFLEKYLDNEQRNKKRKFITLENKKTYKSRNGIMFTFLIPRDFVIEKEKINRVLKKMMNFIIDKEKGLVYCWTVKKKKVGYNKFIYLLVVWCCDREYYPHKETIKYKKDIYYSSVTNTFCKADDPNAKLIHKKGEVKAEKDMLFKTRKSRLFCFANTQAFISFVNTVKDYYISLLETVYQTKIHNGIIFRRKNLKKAYSRFIRRIMLANNRCRKYIQDKLNFLFWKLKQKYGEIPWELMKMGDRNVPFDELELPKNIQTKFDKLVQKYRKIFSNDVFTYEENLDLPIYKTSCNVVENNINFLMEHARIEINNFDTSIALENMENIFGNMGMLVKAA